MKKIDLAWNVLTKYERLQRIVEVHTPKYELTLENVINWIKDTDVKSPRIPHKFSASFSRSLKSLKNRRLIKIYKDNYVIVHITGYGRKIVEQYLL